MAINSKVNQTSAVAFPSYNTIAKMTGMSKPTVIKSVKRLIEVGLLLKTEIAYNSNRYTIKRVQQTAEKLGFTEEQIIKQIEKKKHMPFEKYMEVIEADQVDQKPGETGKQDDEKKADPIPYKAIIEHLNGQAGTKFSHKGSANQKLIKARFNEGYTIEEFKSVIDIKVEQWKNSDMAQYLRPSTLFGNKFDQYLNEQYRSRSPKPPGSNDRKQQIMDLLGDD
jgi:uncharacterized phage protein (TIGR02220 family)